MKEEIKNPETSVEHIIQKQWNLRKNTENGNTSARKINKVD